MTPGPEDDEAFRRGIEALNAEYRRDLRATIASLENLWQALKTRTAAPSGMTDLLRELHTLAGTAATFGLAAVSETAAAAEAYIEPYCTRAALPAARAQAEFERLLEALKRSATPLPDHGRAGDAA
ncbi:MAG: Hpt domain-containing protein [Burkholderiales bacterium]|nr:Hpt domain-containing protein [Burkholderiales bacterium]